MKSKSIFQIRKERVNKLFFLPKFRLGDYLMLQKSDVVRGIFYFGLLFAYLSSATPWFLYSVFLLSPLIAAIPIVLSLLLSNSLKTSLFSRQDYLRTFLAYSVYALVVAVLNGRNIFGLVFLSFDLVIFFSFFKLDPSELSRLSDFFAKVMGCLLSVSIPFYLLYLAGFPLPHSSFKPGSLDYSYENYRFFLIDDRFSFELIPRFHSVFLEPSHLAMLCITLLASQIGKWRRWYNIILFVAIIMSFSLAGYIFLVFLFLAARWLKHKPVVGIIISMVFALAVGVIVALNYNKGDNLVNQLIVQRLTINEDGELEGDNRVTSMFQNEYEKMIKSSDVLVGRGTESTKIFGFGNAGYKVYIYQHGIISLVLLVILLFTIAFLSPYPRSRWAFLAIQFLSFIPHATPVKYYFFIPLFIMLYQSFDSHKEKLPTLSQWKQSNA